MIIFLPCVKTKKSFKTEARNLYDSPYFNKLLSYAKSLNPDNIYILSAKYYVLEPEDIIEPYNKTLKNFSERKKKLWAYEVYKELKEKEVDFDEKSLFLVGKDYRKYLVKLFSDSRTPLEGLGYGEQLHFLNEKLN